MVYWNSTTLACMEVVRELQSAGLAVFFTIDAGPQLKAVCEPAATASVREALASVPGVEEVLVSGLGAGAERIVDD
jgi:diphosphomevalonate decarboxylase